MSMLYSDYSRDRIGWFFGLSGPKLAVLTVAATPILLAIQTHRWPAALYYTAVFLAVLALTVIRIRGRSSMGWVWGVICFLAAGVTGSRRFTARAVRGMAGELDAVDLPGVLQGIEILDGPPQGAGQARPALILNHAAGTWAATAAVVHPGIGMLTAEDRSRHGAGLGRLLDLAVRTELVEEIIVVVRTVPDDGAERELWVDQHRVPDGHALPRTVNDDLAETLTRATVRTESFVTFVVPEARISREARESGGGIPGRGRVLCSLMGEIEAELRGGMGMTDVRWLSSPELALATRTGFAPADRASVVAAQAAREADAGVNADVPWALAGPSGADQAVRHYRHDAWHSISETLILPTRGVVLGALAPILTPSTGGERRTLMVCYPVLSSTRAERASDNAEFAADMGSELRRIAQVKPRARHRADAAKAAQMDAKLATGSAMTRPYTVATVTVAATLPIAEYGRRLDGSVRRAGFAPLRLDLAQDAGFAAACVPLGVSLTRTRLW
jgi:hypothetical protein